MDRCTSLYKALDILAVLGGQPLGLKIQEIAAAMNLPRSTVVRIVNTLVEYGLVARTGRRLVCTASFATWACGDRHASYRQQYRPVLERVSKWTGELVLLGVHEGNGVVHLDFIESDHQLRVAPAPDTRHNLRFNALGKLAISRRADLSEKWATADPAFAVELEAIRNSGVAWNREETVRGMIALAMPGLSNAPTEPMLAVAWPSCRFDDSVAQVAMRAIREACAIDTSSSAPDTAKLRKETSRSALENTSAPSRG